MNESLTILVPTYNEEENLSNCVAALEDMILKLASSTNLNLNILFIDNCSRDATWPMIEQILEGKKSWSGVRLDRNYGIQASLLKGMSLSKSDGLLVFQSDLQDPVDTAVELVHEWMKGSKVSAGITTSRSEGTLDRLSRLIFYKILAKTSDFGLKEWFHDFYVLDRSVYVNLYRQGFQHEFIRGRIAEEYGVDTVITYKRLPRLKGKSSFNFGRKYAMAMDGLLRYGNRVSRTISLLAFSLSIVNVALFLSLLISWLLGYRSPNQGWLSLVSLNLLILSSVGLLIGISFEYLFRIFRSLESVHSPVVSKSINL